MTVCIEEFSKHWLAQRTCVERWFFRDAFFNAFGSLLYKVFFCPSLRLCQELQRQQWLVALHWLWHWRRSLLFKSFPVKSSMKLAAWRGRFWATLCLEIGCLFTGIETSGWQPRRSKFCAMVQRLRCWVTLSPTCFSRGNIFLLTKLLHLSCRG